MHIRHYIIIINTGPFIMSAQTAAVAVKANFNSYRTFYN